MQLLGPKLPLCFLPDLVEVLVDALHLVVSAWSFSSGFRHSFSHKKDSLLCRASGSFSIELSQLGWWSRWAFYICAAVTRDWLSGGFCQQHWEQWRGGEHQKHCFCCWWNFNNIVPIAEAREKERAASDWHWLSPWTHQFWWNGSSLPKQKDLHWLSIFM